MSNPPRRWLQNARTAAAQDKKVLAVEGKNDQFVLEAWLDKETGPRWTDKVYLCAAGDRGSLLAGLRWLRENADPSQTSIFGLADRDEWEATETAALQAELNTLLINPQRHSLESYFCDPDELEQILSARDAATGKGEFAPLLVPLRERMTTALPEYVAHWALCHVIQRANERVRSDAKYPKFFKDKCPLPSDDEIQHKLAEWNAILEPSSLFQEFAELRAVSLRRPISDQLRGCVESTRFFGTEVVGSPVGLKLAKTQDKDQWMIELARWSPAMPPDLVKVLSPVLT